MQRLETAIALGVPRSAVTTANSLLRNRTCRSSPASGTIWKTTLDKADVAATGSTGSPSELVYLFAYRGSFTDAEATGPPDPTRGHDYETAAARQVCDRDCECSGW
jgi:hypothetical protein